MQNFTEEGCDVVPLAVNSAMTLEYWHGCAPYSEYSFEGSQLISELHEHLPEHPGHLALSQLNDTKKRPFCWKFGWNAIPNIPNSASEYTLSVKSRKGFDLSIANSAPDPCSGTVANHVLPVWFSTTGPPSKHTSPASKLHQIHCRKHFLIAIYQSAWK